LDSYPKSLLKEHINYNGISAPKDAPQSKTQPMHVTLQHSHHPDDHQGLPHLLTPIIWWLLQKGKQNKKHTQQERVS